MVLHQVTGILTFPVDEVKCYTLLKYIHDKLRDKVFPLQKIVKSFYCSLGNH